MKPKIHPTAIVSKKARLGPGVVIGPYTLVGPKVRIGSDTTLGSHVVIEGETEIGKRCRIFAGTCIGFPAQVQPSVPVNSSIVIGNDNVFREHVTINTGMKDGSKTVIGHRNILMIGSHVAHDCALGSDIIIANNSALAGHVTVEDRAVVGGLVGIHQYVRVGKLAMIGGLSKVVMDVAPFSINDGRPSKYCALNVVGLRRAGFKSTQMRQIKKALKLLLGDRHNFARVIPKVENELGRNPEVRYLLSFIQKSRRGVARISA